MHIDVHEEQAGRGFQDLKNAGRFWRATQIMGTRKPAKNPHKLGFPLGQRSAWSLKIKQINQKLKTNQNQYFFFKLHKERDYNLHMIIIITTLLHVI